MNVKVPWAVAVPAKVPVPFPLSVKPTPWGSPLWPEPVEVLRATDGGRDAVRRDGEGAVGPRGPLAKRNVRLMSVPASDAAI